MTNPEACCCDEIADLAIFGMGDANGADSKFLATIDHVQDFGPEKWWLYLSRCRACGQDWMLAQEERIHDNYCLKRIAPNAARDIVENGNWPDDFSSYEHVLRLGVEAGLVAHFLNPRSPALVDTVRDLRAARPEITLEEIACVLAISKGQAARLARPLPWWNPARYL